MEPDNGPDEVTTARQTLRVLEVHAAHRKKASAALDRLAADVTKHLEKMGAPASPGAEWPALDSACDLLDNLSRAVQEKVLNRLPEEIREEVVERLYSFDSLSRQNARTIQNFLRIVDRRILATALIGAAQDIRASVLRNMSQRGATMMEEDIESLIRAGDLTTADVREARGEVGGILYRMHENGQVEAEQP